MLKAKSYLNLAIAMLFAIVISGCYTQLAPRLSDEDSAQAPEDSAQASDEYAQGDEQFYDENVAPEEEGDVDVYIYGMNSFISC